MLGAGKAKQYVCIYAFALLHYCYAMRCHHEIHYEALWLYSLSGKRACSTRFTTIPSGHYLSFI